MTHQDNISEYTNGLWPRLENVFDNLLRPYGLHKQENQDNHRHVYSIRRLPKRLRDQEKASVDSLCGLLDSSLASDDPIHNYIGYYESELLHWLNSQSDINVLLLLAHSGGGKSSLLHYVFNYCWPKLTNNNQLKPIFMDC